MGTWIDFILERYNYWIVIVLMMIGLYTVFARGNLVKKVVGLNLFQTSVFIFYITIGKIAGGTAPIYMGGELDHGDGHGEGAGDDHGGAAGDGAEAEAEPHGAGDAADVGDSLHGKIENTVGNASVNDLKAALQGERAAHGADAPSLHDAPVADADAGKIGNDALMDAAKPDALGFEETADHGADAVHGAADAAHSVGEIIYSNPLPHVLILTAIVVGVATTAVGLALSVRIREAYGTIEEDELEALDEVAEFGERETAGGAA